MVRDAEGAPRFSQGVLVDVTPTRATEAELHDERHRAQRYLDIAGAIIVVLDADARVTLLNRAGHELLGYAEGELIGRDWFEAVVPERLRGRGARRAIAAELAGDQDDAVHESPVRDQGRRGAHDRLARHGRARRRRATSTAMMSCGVDLTERRAAEEQIAYLAYHDSLTGPAQPRAAAGAPRARAGPRAPPGRARSRCSTSTSTTSSSSTTRSAMPPATSCCAT